MMASSPWTGRRCCAGTARCSAASTSEAADRTYYKDVAPSLAGPTQTALTQATSPQEWNALFLSSPDFMRR